MSVYSVQGCRVKKVMFTILKMQLFENLEIFYKKQDIPSISVGDTLRSTLYLELPKKVGADEKKEKERIQVYEGVIIAKHRNTKMANATITVRKVFQGVGIEKVILLHSPWVKDMNVISRSKVRRAKLYFLRERTGKSARLKRRF